MKIISYPPFVRAEHAVPHDLCQGKHSERGTKSMRNSPVSKPVPLTKGVSTYISHIIRSYSLPLSRLMMNRLATTTATDTGE